MAGNLPVPNGVECKLVWTLNGQQHALNILHFRNGSNAAITQAIADQIDSGTKSAFSSSGLAGQLATVVSLLHVETRNMSSNQNPWLVGAAPPVDGTGAGHPLPAATSFVITLRTGFRGRSYNGRVYLMGWDENANDAAGGATQAAANAGKAFIDAIRVALVTATPSLEMGVLSRFHTVPPATTPTERNPPIISPVTAIVNTDLRWDTQRRRAKPGV